MKPGTAGVVDRFVSVEVTARPDRPLMKWLRLREDKERPHLGSSDGLGALLHEYGLGSGVQEELWVVVFDAAASVRAIYAVAKGGYHDCDLSIPAILSPVFLEATDRFAVAHNHPSGEMDATANDLDLTDRLLEASDLLGLEFLDHLILGPGGQCFSVREERPKRRRRKAAHASPAVSA